MGSQAIQGKLWGQKSSDWSAIQEPTAKAGYEFVLDFLQLKPGAKLLDIGCGSGLFSKMAHDKGAEVTAIDATKELLEEAQKKAPGVIFSQGEMEELPFEDITFDVVCGFNSFQYASDTKNALTEAKRVLNPGGKLVAMIWGEKTDCEAAKSLKAIGDLLPPPPPGAPGPFALTENHLLEKILEEIGLTILNTTDVDSIWDYPDTDSAIKGFLSSGPAARVIEHAGIEKATSALVGSMSAFTKDNGHVVYHNKFRVVIAEK
jgi:ubiquinone/menaquinone biosynthesis C-methylase UbiE